MDVGRARIAADRVATLPLSIHMRAIKPTRNWVESPASLILPALGDLDVSCEWIGRYFGVEVDAIRVLWNEHCIAGDSSKSAKV